MSNPKKSSFHDFTPSTTYHLTFDEYSEPMTMPAHWDLSELPASMKSSGDGHSEQHSQVEQGAPSQSTLETPEHDGDGAGGMGSDWQRNSFPEPRTFPVYWDFSW
jgi:hypothetical protein